MPKLPDFFSETDYPPQRETDFQAGIEYAQEQLAAALGVDEYECSEGEDLESDISSTLWNIFAAAGLVNPDAAAPYEVQLRQAVKNAVEVANAE
jgi:hypothetical protein